MRNQQSVLLRSLAFALVVGSLFTSTASAQYFGRNKVQYENFDFKVKKTEHFDIYYYDREKNVVDDIGRMAERWYTRLSGTFSHTFTRKPIVLYANAADFAQTTTTPGLIGQGTGGFTDPLQNRIVMPLTGDYAENDHVLGHEMVHVFQFDIANTSSRPTAAGQRRRFNLELLPLWIVEGMAEYLSKGRVDPLTAMWLRDAAARNKLPDIQKLTRDPRYFPYRYGQALFAYIGGRYGDDAVIAYFLAAGESGPEQGFERALGIPAKQVFAEWHAATRAQYSPITQSRTPSTLGNALLQQSTTRGNLNISPSYSPDGRYIAFLSTRELFSIDLYIADAKTGAIQRRLVSSESNAHFDALRFIDSAGSWSPDSKRLAFAVVQQGDNRLAIVDVDSGNVERISIPGMDALSNPAFSPDGQWVAFSGQTTGVTDLYVYNLATKELRQLTNDKYADLQPQWSPDGRTIVFASDRGPNADIERLRFDNMKIATVDVASGRVETLRLFDAGKHINPYFSPDGRSIYFVANPDGIPDVYRAELGSGAISRITRVATGVSGITELAPALTVAARTGDLAFSVYERDDHNIYTLPSTAAATPVQASLGVPVPVASLLPPERATGSSTTITNYLQQTERGLLPPGTTFPVSEYKPSLHLTYLGPPTVGVGVDTRGGFGLGGTVSAYFSDVLGHHNVGFTVQGGGTSGTDIANSIGAEVIYLNQTHRVNWGGAASHIPYISAVTYTYRENITLSNGQTVVADVLEQRRDIETFDEVQALSQYPLSLTRRLELNGGYQRIGFEREVESEYYVGGQFFDRRTRTIGDTINIDLYKAAAAFVGDSSTFGFISPVKGTRYRFEAQALTGDLNFQTGLADYRKYFFARPFTFAFRGLHYGRYGEDAENNQLSLLYVGQETLVRGYSIDSIDLSECNQTGGSEACPVFDRLVGSKIGVASAEFRIPLLGTKEFGLIDAGLPVELSAFVDAGVAWTDNESPKFKFKTDTDERVPVVSAGVAMRVLLAYIPLQLYYAHPFQRPEKDWVFGFTISPGW